MIFAHQSVEYAPLSFWPSRTSALRPLGSSSQSWKRDASLGQLMHELFKEVPLPEKIAEARCLLLHRYRTILACSANRCYAPPLSRGNPSLKR